MEEKIKKDVIYIDIDDDITDVVQKIKTSKEKIVAIVPPKGLGVFRSSVNLRLLAKTSSKAGKRIVIINSSPNLLTMAAAAGIPVAKTLQSKPEVPEIDVLEIDNEDIIDGESLPVAAFAGKSKEDEEAEILSQIDIDDNKKFSKVALEAAKEAKKKSAPAIKIPNFNAFRKKLFIFGGLGVAVLIFLIWAIFIAPAATVIIKAKTSDLNVSQKLSLSGTASEVNFEQSILPLKTEVIEKVEEVKFDATGSKDVGEPASGVLNLTQRTESSGYSIKAGTAFSSGECNFVTLEGANVSGFGVSLSGGQVQFGAGTGSVKIRATQNGDKCNLPAGSRFTSTIAGLNATSGQLSGGVSKTVKVVSESDATAARQKLQEAKNDNVKNELLAKFGEDFKVLEESYAIEAGEAEVSPAVGQETSDGKAIMKVKTRYKISAISKKHIEEYLAQFVNSKIKPESQQIYETGFKDFQLTAFNGADSAIHLSASAKIGPKINESELKSQIKGKVFGEVQSHIEAIEGVRNVDVKFSYFWVSRIPTDDKKIKIEFTVE